jgi:hypothetical protein
MTKLQGLEQFQKRLKEATERMKKAVGAGLYVEGQNIVGDAKEKVPLDTGTLSRSHYVTLPQEVSGRMAVEIGCGGPAEAYALRQHEDTNLRHADGREAKWFENAYKRAMPNFMRNVSDVAREAFAANKGARKGSEPSTPWEGEDGGGGNK